MAKAICKTPLRSRERISAILGAPVWREENSLTSIKRMGVSFQGLLCSPLKSGGFCGTFVCTSKGYVERETSLASLEREGGIFLGSLCSPLKSGGFCGTFVCTRLEVVKVW